VCGGGGVTSNNTLKASASNIWRIPAFLPYVQPKLIEKAIASAQRRLGWALPPPLLALLSEQNGGAIRWKLPGQVHDTIRGIGRNWPALGEADWRSYEAWLPFSLKDAHYLVPFDGNGHWYLCLDYRHHATKPSVSLVDIEASRVDPIGESFEDYLNLLELPELDDTFAVLGVFDIESFKVRLALKIGLKVEEPSDIARGYMNHRLVKRRSKPPAGMALHPNLVPRGYVRPDEAESAKLRRRLPGVARFSRRFLMKHG